MPAAGLSSKTDSARAKRLEIARAPDSVEGMVHFVDSREPVAAALAEWLVSRFGRELSAVPPAVGASVLAPSRAAASALSAEFFAALARRGMAGAADILFTTLEAEISNLAAGVKTVSASAHVFYAQPFFHVGTAFFADFQRNFHSRQCRVFVFALPLRRKRQSFESFVGDKHRVYSRHLEQPEIVSAAAKGVNVPLSVLESKGVGQNFSVGFLMTHPGALEH